MTGWTRSNETPIPTLQDKERRIMSEHRQKMGGIHLVKRFRTHLPKLYRYFVAVQYQIRTLSTTSGGQLF